MASTDVIIPPNPVPRIATPTPAPVAVVAPPAPAIVTRSAHEAWSSALTNCVFGGIIGAGWLTSKVDWSVAIGSLLLLSGISVGEALGTMKRLRNPGGAALLVLVSAICTQTAITYVMA